VAGDEKLWMFVEPSLELKIVGVETVLDAAVLRKYCSYLPGVDDSIILAWGRAKVVWLGLPLEVEKQFLDCPWKNVR